MEIFVPSGRHSTIIRLFKKVTETKKSREVSEMVTPGFDQSDATPLKSKGKNERRLKKKKKNKQ